MSELEIDFPQQTAPLDYSIQKCIVPSFAISQHFGTTQLHTLTLYPHLYAK
jgi:hypothetical protein